MNKYLLFLLAVAFPLTGCAGHYYKVQSDKVNVYLKMPDAKVVEFASSLDEYDVRRAKKIDNKTWENVVPTSFEFRYFYIVDGQLYLPDCKFKETDDLGSENCIYVPRM